MGKICEVCGKDVEKVRGCIQSKVCIDGTWYTRKRFTNDNVNALLEADPHCFDCGVEPGLLRSNSAHSHEDRAWCETAKPQSSFSHQRSQQVAAVDKDGTARDKKREISPSPKL